ncbi:MAG TPA: response regulator [Rhodospirillaceae bacterium]|nr:response regulator [Rhodospirillaceae bacterium]
MGGYSLERLNVLVVDDSPHMRHLVKVLLFSFGCRTVVEAEDVPEADKLLQDFPADLIICDWNMPSEDGISFVRRLRTGEESRNPYVPVILMTGHTQKERILTARDAGVNEFLAKPISAKSLFQRIRAIIERPWAFVRAETYCGPDRRRKQVDLDHPNRRQKVPAKGTPGIRGAAVRDDHFRSASGAISASGGRS